MRVVGTADDVTVRRLLEEGQNFIQKPSTPAQLLETVRKCLDG